MNALNIAAVFSLFLELSIFVDSAPRFNVTVRYADPCSAVHSSSIKHLNNDVWAISTNYTLCDNSYVYNTTKPALRIRTQSDKSLVFVARDETDTQTWKLPFQYYGSFYNNYDLIICNTMLTDSDNEFAAYIDAFTDNNESIQYEIEIQAVTDFELKLNESRDYSVAANAPLMVYFQFPENVTSVNITAHSDSNATCVIVSIQNASCPVKEFPHDVRSGGVFQTMTKLSSIFYEKNNSSESDEFFVVIVLVPNSMCNTESKDWNPGTLSSEDLIESKNITLTIHESKSANFYIFPIFFPIIIFTALGILVTLSFVTTCFDKCTFTPFTKIAKCCKKYKVLNENEDEQTPINKQNTSSYDNTLNVENTNGNTTERHSILQIPEKDVRLNHVLTMPMSDLKKDYNGYIWNTITVAIFYGLPAFQLVLTKQLILNFSGNQDVCYYNFLCLKHLDGFNAFNNNWSNIGYGILGVFFVLISAIRHYQYWKNSQIHENYGLPQFFGLYYTMGIALITEGFMSAFYHICPSRFNFQFDTAFMFIISGLLIIKIIQSRHPHMYTNAFIALLCLAVIILVTFFGIFEESKESGNKYDIKLTLFFCFFIGIIIFGIFHYFYIGCRTHDIKKNYILNWFKSWCTDVSCHSYVPRHLVRFLKLFSFMIINLALGGYLIFKPGSDFAIIVLALFIANLLWLLLIYIISKLCHNEPWTIKPIVFLVLMGVSWLGAFWFYTHSVTQWKISPAASRELNKPCILFDFYDNHDIWHFLSAAAMFFSFLFLMVLDDGLIKIKRNKIHVF